MPRTEYAQGRKKRDDVAYCVVHFAQFFKPGNATVRGRWEVRSNNRGWPSRISIDLVGGGLAFSSPPPRPYLCVETAVPRMRAREEEEEEAQKSLLERCEVRTKTSLVSNQS